MTRDEILNMPAGEEMDALIAEIMGERRPGVHVHTNILSMEWSSGRCWYCLPDYEKGDSCEWTPKPFSDNISAAWEVVEKFYSMKLDRFSNGKEWRCYLVTLKGGKNHDATGLAYTAPLAICRAALLAKMEIE